MLKLRTVKKQLETFFKKNEYRYTYMNNKIKSLSIPVYLLGLNVISEDNEEEKSLGVIVSIFSSSHVICFECLNLYRFEGVDSLEILNKINIANNYSFPGKFALKNDNSITYCCFIDYTYSENLHNDVILSIINSIPPAYFIFSDIVNNKEK